MASRKICSKIFPGSELRLIGLVALGVSFLPYLKKDMVFFFLQSLGTSLKCHGFSKMIEWPDNDVSQL